MQIDIRQETRQDFEATEHVIQSAFANVEYSDQSEHLLVKRLRDSPSFIPELSLVALVDNRIVGHILLTKIKITNDISSHDALALAPVSVKKDYKGKGIGGQLILEAHNRAVDLGHKSIVLLGHGDYYPRFGYKRASLFGINIPFDAPDEHCMAIELIEGALTHVSGTVQYDPCFYE